MSKEDQAVLEKKIEEGTKAERKAKRKAQKKEAKKKAGGFFKDFRKFITKGNVVDLAVAVVIGAAFNAIVNGLVKMIINPLIALLTDGVSLDGWKTVLKEKTETSAEVAILWGEWIQTIINFFIIALTVFLMVRVITRVTNTIQAKEIQEKKLADAKKAEEDKKKAEAQAAIEAQKEAALQQFYANVARQTELLEEMAKK
jgi:large conductance mechanosensitive channel